MFPRQAEPEIVALSSIEGSRRVEHDEWRVVRASQVDAGVSDGLQDVTEVGNRLGPSYLVGDH